MEQHSVLIEFFFNSFEGDTDVQITESGSQKQMGDKDDGRGTSSSGSYSYPGPDGRIFTVRWTVDESGDHLPGQGILPHQRFLNN